MSTPPTLHTARLVLRPWRDADRAPFAALNADPEVMEHFPALQTAAESDAYAERIRAHFAREGFGLWAVETADAPFIGFAGLARPTFMPGVVEIGWRLARAHWGHGYATEAARAAARHAFGPLGLPELVSFTIPANTRSQHVMAELGMVRDPTADFDHPNVPAGNPARAHWLFRLPAAAFTATD